ICGSLSLMWMMRTAVHFQLPPHCTTQLRLGKHSAHGFPNQFFRVLGQQIPRSDLAQATGIPRMTAVHLFGELLSRKLYPLSVDDDYVVSRIQKGHIRGLILAGKQTGHSTRKSPQHFALGIQHMPVTLNFTLSRYVALHTTPKCMTTRSEE